MKPQEPIPHNYPMRRLNLIFAGSSLVLLMTTGLIVGYDYVRGWKWFQREFLRMQRERIQQDMGVAEKESNKAQLAQLDVQARANQVEIARHRQQYLLAQKDVDSWEGKHYAADQDYRFAKASLDAQRYNAETSVVQKRDDAREQLAEYKRQEQHVNDLQLRLQDVTRARDASRARVDQWLKKVTEEEDQRKQLTASMVLLNKQLATVSENGAFKILNSPMLDFVSPTFKVDQVVLSDLFVEMNYMSVPRVDRCMTCHQAMDRPGFESKKEAARMTKEIQGKLDSWEISTPEKRKDAEDRIVALKRTAEQSDDKEVLNPWRTHPRLDTFVGSASPHPLLEYGCTSCHRGQDRATEFGRAGHVPASPKMEHRWSQRSWMTLGFFPTPGDMAKRHWGFEENPYNETPMYPRQHYEAGCIKCHSGQMTVDGGESITKATATVELYGCYACHKISDWRFTDLRKPGPDLNGIAEKTTPQWAIRWIAEPHAFRSTTRMPSFFYQRNMIDPAVVPAVDLAQNVKYQDAEVHAIVSYLFARSTHRVWQAPAAGDAGRGKQIVSSVGCLACHIDSEFVQKKAGEKDIPDTGFGPVPAGFRRARRDDYPLERNFGFNLAGVGTKTHPGWVYNWVKNPKNYYPDAPMPSLRLSDAEASDVTAYLMSLQKPQFLQTPVRNVDPKAVHDLAKSYLINTLSDRDAETKLRTMPMDAQLVYLGQRSIEKYGCYSCHNIKGFEGLKPIGTELTIEGSKALHLFDFGFAHSYKAEDGKEEHVQHSVSSWIYNKLRNPRVYDDERAKSYNDKLKMPNFHMSQDEALRITTVVLGLTKDRVGEAKLAARDPHMRLIEEGRKRVSQHNCRGCHVVDGSGRAIASTIADENFLPPNLSPEGARAQSVFLFNFLKDPTVMKIRPWMNVRMPTFHFTDEEANTLVTYFAEEGKGAAFDTSRGLAPLPKNVAIGKTVFAMLRCAQCHAINPVSPENPPVPNVADSTALAPNLTMARLRLRHEWIADWIRRPNEMIPGTRMPTNFPRDPATGGFQSPLANALDAPQFAQYRTALLPMFGNDEKQMKASMGDAVALSEFLRDYIWSIGVEQMRAAAPNGQAPAFRLPQPPSLPQVTPAKSTRNDRGVVGSSPGK